MSQAGTLNGGGSGGSSVNTITTNSGIATPVANNINLLTANATVVFAAVADTITQDFDLTNLVLGSDLPALTSGSANVGLGSNVLNSLESASGSVCIGYQAGQAITTATNCTYVGIASGLTTTTSQNNTGIGSDTLGAVTTGSGANTALGSSSLAFVQTGQRNIALGFNAGVNYTTSESSNIIIGNSGTAAESNTIRLGTAGVGAGQQSRAFVAGITGVTVAASAPVGVASTGQLSSLGFGTSGQVFTSNGAGVSPTFQTLSGLAVTSITGNSGPAITGAVNIVTSNTTLTFAGAAQTETLDFNLSNLLLGSAGTLITSGTSNVSLGQSAALSLSSGVQNTLIGAVAGSSLATGSVNVFVGFGAGSSVTGGSNNILVGPTAGNNLLTGNLNILIGRLAGTNYTSTESHNILFANSGVLAESGAIRIGSAANQTKAFIAGVTGVTVAASAPVGIDTNGQLSSLGFGTSGQVFTSNGAGVSPTFQTLSTLAVTSIIGTANQVLANGTSGSMQTGNVTLTTPQDIATTSNVTFNTVSTPDGSAGAPSYTNTGDTDTGVYFPGDNQVALTAGSSPNFIVKQFTVESNKLHNFFAGFSWNYSSPGAYPYSVLDASDCIVYIDTSSARTINLPNVPTDGRIFILKDATGNAFTNNITITTPGGVVTIDGVTSTTIAANYGSIMVQFMSTQYFII